MNQQLFESRILHLWMTTRVPLTRANVLFFTHAPRRKAERWLEELVKEGVLDFDSDDQGEVLYAVRGAERPERGPERVEDVLHLEQLRGQIRGGQPGLRPTLASAARGLSTVAGQAPRALGGPGRAGDKSLLASGLLSLFLGPIGWIYAGPLREALPAALAFWVGIWFLGLLPALLMAPAVSLLGAVSGALGVLYAWQYNKRGHATPLLGGDDERPRLSGRR